MSHGQRRKRRHGSPLPRSPPMPVDRREFLAAALAGKDADVEKPLTHGPSEGKAVIEAQNAHTRVVQVGTQQRSMTHIAEAYKFLQSGAVGKVHKAHCTWNRNAPRAQRYKDNIDPKTVDR